MTTDNELDKEMRKLASSLTELNQNLVKLDKSLVLHKAPKRPKLTLVTKEKEDAT